MSPLCFSLFRSKSRTQDRHASNHYTEKLGAGKPLASSESSSTLIGSPICINEDAKSMVDTSDRIADLRNLMGNDAVDY